MMSMKQIAKIAGVSSATVSRVINGSNLVTPTTRAHVEQIIQELKFLPDSNAAALRLGRSHTYGIIIPDITNPFFPEFVKSFEAIVARHEQEIIVANTDLHALRAQQSVRRMLMRRVAGVALLAAESETEDLEMLFNHRVPIVTLDRRRLGLGVSDVSIDYESGMEQAVNHLRHLGHSRIGFLAGTPHLRTSQIRRKAFQRALRHFGLKPEPQFIKVGDFRVAGGEVAMNELLQQKEKPSAIIAINDLTAIGALRALRKQNLSVPDDMSLVGFDDIDVCDIISPALTTIRISRSEMAEVFFQALEETAKRITAIGVQIMIPSKLVVRESTARLRSSSASKGRPKKKDRRA
jgi:DNA-binding LacI/PurR family transcriptional regulator